MTKQIHLQTKDNLENNRVKVRIIKAPLVDNNELQRIIFARTRAVTLQ
jgi:hypothetical protein